MIPFLDFSEENVVPKKSSKRPRVLALLCILGVLTIGTTLARNITINANANHEFGQGVTAAAACDSNGIKLSPIYSFVNIPKSGKFTFNAIQMDNISSNCTGKDFIIKVYDKNNDLIPLTNDTENPVTTIHVWFHELPDDIKIADVDGDPDTVSSYGYWAEEFTLSGEGSFNVLSLGNLASITEDEVVPGNNARDYFIISPEDNSVQIVLDPTGNAINNFSDSRNVYKFTIETFDHGI